MNRSSDFAIREFARILDVITIFAAFYIAYYIRAHEAFAPFMNEYFGDYMANQVSGNFGEVNVESILWVIVPLWLFLFSYSHTYAFGRTGTFGGIFKNLTKVHFIGTLILIAYIYATNAWMFRRSFLFFFVFFSFSISFFVRFLILMGLRVFRVHGRNTNRAIIIGSGEKALKILSELKNHTYWGFTLEGIVTEEKLDVKKMLGQKVLGQVADIKEILRDMPIDDVFLATEEGDVLELKQLLKTCENIGVNVYLIPDKYDMEIAKSTVGSLGELEFISFSTTSVNMAQKFLKRALDVMLSLMLLPFLFVAYVVVGLIIKLDSKGPVVYRSTRITRSRRPFVFYKFRTMEAGAEEVFEDHTHDDEMEGPISKIKDDPRVTKVGRFLRKYSIDELPQVINVFFGDMSLVGPRPPTAEEVKQYSFSQLRKLSMQQGITGLWQVNGRDKIVRFEDRLKLDLEYIDNWSIWLDLKILIKTPYVLLKGAM